MAPNAVREVEVITAALLCISHLKTQGLSAEAAGHLKELVFDGYEPLLSAVRQYIRRGDVALLLSRLLDIYDKTLASPTSEEEERSNTERREREQASKHLTYSHCPHRETEDEEGELEEKEDAAGREEGMEEDVQLLVQKTGVTSAKAREALEEKRGDLVDAILLLIAEE